MVAVDRKPSVVSYCLSLEYLKLSVSILATFLVQSASIACSFIPDLLDYYLDAALYYEEEDNEL